FCGPAAAQTAEEFYKNKTLTLIVGFEAGGASDGYARLRAQHLPRHVPGHPGMIVQNMAGAGSFTAANHLYNRAPHDGTMLGIVGEGLTMGQLFKLPGVNFDMGKFGWIGRLASSVEMTMAWHTATVKAIKDVFHTELLLG